jgi:hypothetical protein
MSNFPEVRSISPFGHAMQDFVKQDLGGEKAKDADLKVQSAVHQRQIRVTGKKRDELQEVIAFCRSRDFEVPLAALVPAYVAARLDPVKALRVE